MKYTVQHLGYPTTSPIQPDQWKKLSEHASVDAAFRAIAKRTAHLDYGTWDDHYRVVDKDGNVQDFNAWRDEQARKSSDKLDKRHKYL